MKVWSLFKKHQVNKNRPGGVPSIEISKQGLVQVCIYAQEYKGNNVHKE